MGLPAVGTVVLIKFPFTDMKNAKKRPALVVAHSRLNSIIACQISSRQPVGSANLPLAQADFASGGLPVESYIKIDKIQTFDAGLAERSLGALSKSKRDEIMQSLRDLFS